MISLQPRKPHHTHRVVDNGTLVTECDHHLGKGLLFTGAQLGKLASKQPKSTECKTFTVQVHNAEGQLGFNLADICQQHVVATEGTRTLFKQRAGSCMYVVMMCGLFCVAVVVMVAMQVVCERGC